MNTHILRSHTSDFILRKMNIATAGIILGVMTLGTAVGVYASATSNFGQTINAGTLSVDIVDATSYVTVGSPSITMGAKTFSFSCQSGGSASTGTFGTSSQAIYIKNPDASDTGWTVDLAASSPTAVWDSAVDYDFNDAGGSGCTDGGDTDSLGGQMTVNPATGTLVAGACSTCTTTSVTKGSSASFVEGSTNSVNILSGAAGSDDIGDWKLTGVTISQTIPAEQAAANDYDINMTLSVTAV